MSRARGHSNRDTLASLIIVYALETHPHSCKSAPCTLSIVEGREERGRMREILGSEIPI